MAAQPKTVGGGSAKPLANDFLNFLRTGLNSGTFGNGAVDSTKGIAGILNDILSGGGGNVGGALAKQIENQRSMDVNSLRARFGAGGGSSYGTPAAFAESQYLSDSAANLPTAIGQLQLSALMPLLGIYNNATSLGTPQAQTVMQQNPFAAGLDLVTSAGSAAFPYLKAANLFASSPSGAAGKPYTPNNLG